MKFPIVRKLWDTLLERRCTIDEIHSIAKDKYDLKGVTGRPVPRSVIYNIFTNPFYYGDFNWAGKQWKGTHQPMITKVEFDEVQRILKGKGKPSNKKHYFAFTGMIRCGECGGMITAENKTKHQKNGNVHHYTFYHCTKRKGVPCSQRFVREELICEQIQKIIDSIDIPHEFTEWALDVIREDNNRDKAARDTTLKKYQQEYSGHLAKLDRIKDMRINGELSPEDFNTERTRVLANKDRTQKLMDELDTDISKRTFELEQKLNFAETAKTKFTQQPETRKNILSCLGSNLILKDKKLTLDLDEIFTGVRTASKTLKKLHSRLEPVKNGYDKGEYADMYASNPELGHYPNFIISLLESNNYIESLHASFVAIKSELLVTNEV